MPKVFAFSPHIEHHNVVKLPQTPVTWEHFMDVNKKGQTRGTLERALGVKSTVSHFPETETK